MQFVSKLKIKLQHTNIFEHTSDLDINENQKSYIIYNKLQNANSLTCSSGDVKKL